MTVLRPLDDMIERGDPYHDERGRFTTPNGAAGGAVPVADKPGKQAPPATKRPSTAWKTRPNADLRVYLVKKESTADRPDNGYGVKAKNGALGRHQVRLGALVDAGWKNTDGTWTEKANEAGVKNDSDFLRNPDVQEQALTDLLEKYHDELKKDGSLDYVGKTITDSAGNRLTVTEAGLIAAAHEQGSTAVRAYLDAASKGTLASPPSEPVHKGWKNIEGRLRDATDIPYDSAANARQANTGKTGPHAPKEK